MGNTDLILVKDTEAYLERRMRRGGGFGRTLLSAWALIMLVGVVLCAAFLIPRVKDFFGERAISGGSLPSDGDLGGGSGTPSTNQGAQNPPQSDVNTGGTTGGVTGGEADTVPSGAYKIECQTSEYKITNETSIELKGDTPKLVSPAQIRTKYGSEAPLVLITHLAPKEAYSNGKYYSETDNFYSDTENVSALAEILSGKLNALGIKTVYLDEEYAKGSVIGTLEEYEASLKKTLDKYPSISYVISLSRGIYINEGMVQTRETVSVGGEKCAQIRIISGTSGGKMSEAQEESLNFALDFAKFANEKIPTLVSESKIAGFELGQNVSPFALEIELGTYANTYGEAKESVNRLSSLIFEYLSGVGAHP